MSIAASHETIYMIPHLKPLNSISDHHETNPSRKRRYVDCLRKPLDDAYPKSGNHDHWVRFKARLARLPTYAHLDLAVRESKHQVDSGLAWEIKSTEYSDYRYEYEFGRWEYPNYGVRLSFAEHYLGETDLTDVEIDELARAVTENLKGKEDPQLTIVSQILGYLVNLLAKSTSRKGSRAKAAQHYSDTRTAEDWEHVVSQLPRFRQRYGLPFMWRLFRWQREA